LFSNKKSNRFHKSDTRKFQRVKRLAEKGELEYEIMSNGFVQYRLKSNNKLN
jgi:hypothetical protein